MLIAAHGGSASPDYGEYPASLSMWLMEVTWFSHRPLWSLILSGVFDRFPGLRFVEPCLLERRPSDYWVSNCFVAASFLHRDDCERRDRVGTEKIMWGSDYPHLEGTFPFSEEGIRKTFAGLDRSEVEAMLGTNAADLYGFDLALLEPLAAQHGPRADAVAAGLDAIPEGATSLAFRDQVISNV